MLKKISSKREQPWLPEAPQQWWRLPLSVLYHYGIIHCLLVVGAQSFLLSPIEITIGWFRLMILYIVCGCGGLLVCVMFVSLCSAYTLCKCAICVSAYTFCKCTVCIGLDVL